jgi:hypothetical protein
MYSLLVFILLFIFSCAAKKEIPKTESIVEVNPKLIFLNYTISEDDNSVKTVDFISKKIADGKARNSSNKYMRTGHIGDLKCSQLDNKSQTLQSVFIKNPLNKTIEFLNDSLEFQSKSLTLKRAPISLRLQLNSKTEHIIISEIIDSLQNTKPLLITKLNVK